MLDIAVSYNKFKFLGNEFLTWLWYIIENDRKKLVDSENNRISLVIGNRIIIENKLNDDSSEVISIKGDDADLKEGILALKKGAVVTELNIILKESEYEWKFNIKGENFHLSGFKPPETGKVEKKEDIDGAILEKYFLYEKAINIIDSLYKNFLHIRISDNWKKQTVPEIQKWIKADN